MTLSTKTVSSNNKTSQKNTCGTINIVRVSVKASPAEGRRRLHTNMAHAPPFGFQQAFMWSIAGRRPAMLPKCGHGLESMMGDLGFVVKPVLIIDAKATEHILHRHGIWKMKHIDVAQLW